MDTSETYIKMCEKATELQEVKRKTGLAHGDYFYNPETLQWDIVYDKTKCYRYGMVGNLIWLPRQDQLQEMVRLPNYNAKHEYDRLLEWWNDRAINEGKWIKMAGWSHEQLWLAFVMHEKYSKTWNGTDWCPLPDKRGIN